MTKLDKLYSIIRNSRELGLEPGEDVLRQTSELEENIIKNDILPVLSDNIEPLLNPIQRDLVLVVEYYPGQPISVALSRKAKAAEILEAKTIEQDPEAQHQEGKKGTKKTHISPKTGLCVYRKDGSFIQDKVAANTFVAAIEEADAMRVRELGLIVNNIPLVSNTKDKKYGSQQHLIENGWYVITNTSTQKKKDLLDRINTALHLGWKVEIVK